MAIQQIMTNEIGVAILLKDTQGEKNHGKVENLFRSRSRTVCRGELLISLPRVKVVPRKDGKAAHNFQLDSDPSVTLFCPEDDVAPLSDYEYSLMVAIKSRGARFDVFRKDMLDWGSKLKKGTFMYVALPSITPVTNQRAVSLIRYVGQLPHEHGTLFGAEIQVITLYYCNSAGSAVHVYVCASLYTLMRVAVCQDFIDFHPYLINTRRARGLLYIVMFVCVSVTMSVYDVCATK